MLVKILINRPLISCESFRFPTKHKPERIIFFSQLQHALRKHIHIVKCFDKRQCAHIRRSPDQLADYMVWFQMDNMILHLALDGAIKEITNLQWQTFQPSHDELQWYK